MHAERPRRVVVGVDGTPRTVTALRWAASEALRRDAELHAVLACGDAPRRASYAPVSAASDPVECARLGEEKLAAAVAAAIGGTPPVPVSTVVDGRAPVPALLDHAKDAELLVLAVRPAAGPGSVAISCLRQPPCPVVALPAAAEAADGHVAGVAAGVS